MESFNPHEYVPRRLDAPAKFLLWDFDLVASGIAGLAFGIIVNSLLMGAIASYAAIWAYSVSNRSVIPDTDFITSTGSFLLEPLSALRHRAAAFCRITEYER